MKNRFLIMISALVFCLLFSACTVTLPDAPKAAEQTLNQSSPEPQPTVYPDTELSIIIESGDFSVLDAYPGLAKLDVSGSTCYDAILEFIEQHPDIDVTFSFFISGDGEDIPAVNKDETVVLSNSSYIECLISQAEYFESLKAVDLGQTDASKAQIAALSEAFPEAEISYSVKILGTAYELDTPSVDLRGITASDVDAVCTALELLPQVEKLSIADASGSAPLSYTELAKIAQVCPTGAFDFSFSLFDQTLSAAAERVEYVKADINDEGVARIREVLPFMNRLKYLLLDSCGISNGVMAQLRDDFPDIKVVWRVTFSGDGYNCLTDTEKIWATGSVTDGYSKSLQYCTDVKYMDLGHNCITNIDFVNYMPKLEVLVIAITWVCDISPLANCPELEYLECFTAKDEQGHCLHDLSPLANCKKLRHLNISNLYELTDISPLYNLPDLERVYCTMSDIPQEQQDKIRELHPDCEFNFTWSDPSKGTWRWVDGIEGGERVPRYELLAQQFGYDTLDYSR